MNNKKINSGNRKGYADIESERRDGTEKVID
jgi:hypothetical protein